MSSDAIRRATAKYDKEKIDFVTLRVPKGYKNAIKKHAEENNETINSFIKRAIKETIERDNQK